MIPVQEFSNADLALEVEKLYYMAEPSHEVIREAAERLRSFEWKCSGCGFTTDDGDQLAKHLYKQHLPGNRNERRR